MTRPDPRPGAHGEGIPDASHAAIREMSDDDEGWQPVFEDGEPTEAFRSSLRAYVDAEMGQEPVGVPSKLGRAMAKPMTYEEVDALGERQSRSLREFFDREARTVTVRIYYKGPGNPRAAVESVLKQWSPKVFETEVLDA